MIKFFINMQDYYYNHSFDNLSSAVISNRQHTRCCTSFNRSFNLYFRARQKPSVDVGRKNRPDLMPCLNGNET